MVDSSQIRYLCDVSTMRGLMGGFLQADFKAFRDVHPRQEATSCCIRLPLACADAPRGEGIPKGEAAMKRALLEMTQGMEDEARIDEPVAYFSSTPVLPKSWREGSKWLCKSVQGAIVFHEGDGFHRKGRRLMSALQYNLVLRLPLSFKSRATDRDSFQLFHHLLEEGPRLSVQLLKQRDFCTDPPEELEELRLRAMEELVMGLLGHYDLYRDGELTYLLDRLYPDDPDIGEYDEFPVFPLFIEVATAPGLPSPSTWNKPFLDLLASSGVPPFDGDRTSWYLCGMYPRELAELPVEKPTLKARASQKRAPGAIAPGERYILAEVRDIEMGLSKDGCLQFDWDSNFWGDFEARFGLSPCEAVALVGLDSPEFLKLLKKHKERPWVAVEAMHELFRETPEVEEREGTDSIRDPDPEESLDAFYTRLLWACGARKPQLVTTELTLRVLVDKATSVRFAELAPAGELFSSTLQRAIQVAGLSLLYGKPAELQVSSKLLKEHPEIGQWCKSAGVSPVAPASGAENALAIQREWRRWLGDLVSLRVYEHGEGGVVLGRSVCGRHAETLEPLDASIPLAAANAWVIRRAWSEGDLETFAKEARNTTSSKLVSGCSLRIKIKERFEPFKSRI